MLRALDVIVPDGDDKSNIIGARAVQGGWNLILHGPSAITGGGALTIQVSSDPDATVSSQWNTLEDASGTAIAAPGVLRSKSFPELSAVGAFRIKCASAVTGNTTWKLTQNVTN